jgi:hypothetical protein
MLWVPDPKLKIAIFPNTDASTPKRTWHVSCSMFRKVVSLISARGGKYARIEIFGYLCHLLFWNVLCITAVISKLCVCVTIFVTWHLQYLVTSLCKVNFSVNVLMYHPHYHYQYRMLILEFLPLSLSLLCYSI